MRYESFHLVLMVTHQCNLRCDYCYVGAKSARTMAPAIGHAAISRAIRSIRPGGVLELGFFGGEPLLEADRIATWIDDARRVAGPLGIRVRPGLTTNGTLRTPAAWDVLLREDLEVSISHDGLPEVHDRHRRRADGTGTSEEVLTTIVRLLDAGRPVRVATVVRPDTVASLPDGVRWLGEQGVQRIDLTLDVWAAWNAGDVGRLEEALGSTADLWGDGLPDGGINWFDEKAAHLLRIPMERSARCGFGDGEIAVAPSGNLYPCERLIGEDGADHPMRLPSHVSDGDDFCRTSLTGRSAPACAACAIAAQCNTTCRCNNYVRTGDVGRPDALLCLLDRVCYRETARVLRKMQPAGQALGCQGEHEPCPLEN